MADYGATLLTSLVARVDLCNLVHFRLWRSLNESGRVTSDSFFGFVGFSSMFVRDLASAFDLLLI